MFRSQDHPQGATLFLAKVILKTLIKYFPYINRVLWQHVVLCKDASLRMRLTIGVCSVLCCERLSLRNTLRWPVHKADNLTTILCRCHEIWEP